MTIQLQTYDAEQPQGILEDLVRVYLEIHATPPTPFQNEDRYRRQLAGHMTNPGWKLVTATEDAELVGCAYGVPLQPNTRWSRACKRRCPRASQPRTATALSPSRFHWYDTGESGESGLRKQEWSHR